MKHINGFRRSGSFLRGLTIAAAISALLIVSFFHLSGDVRSQEKRANREPAAKRFKVQEPNAITVQDLTTKTPTELVQTIVGTNVPFSNVHYTGANVASGIFGAGGTAVGFDDGIVLTSGAANSVIGPNINDSTSTANQVPGDPDLEMITPGTFDATVLEFDFVPTENSVKFFYVFASEEYNEFTNDQYNDVFAFYLNGQNVALIPGTATPVAINNVNGGNPYGMNATHPEFFRNNDLDDGGGMIDTELDGLTTVFLAEGPVTPGQTNHIKLAIADVSDEIYDSAVFIKANSFAAPHFATVSGRVYTSGGSGLRNASVTLTPPTGSPRTVLTSSLGYYSFDSVPTDKSYTISVRSKRYRFNPMTVEVENNMSGLDFTGLE